MWPGVPADRDDYRYTLLRRADIQALRRFRNEQIDVLRQQEPISPPEQERWFDEVVVPAQRNPQPQTILVSILHARESFVGYGGLTNISWEARRAEVSFLVDPKRAADPVVYRRDMTSFLGFLQDWSFGALGLNRLFTETYAMRDHHIAILESAGFVPEGRLRQHVMTTSGLTDSVLHGVLAEEWGTR